MLNRKLVYAINQVLPIFGWAIIPINLGRWKVINGKLTCRLIQIGWRLAPRSQWEEAEMSNIEILKKRWRV